MKRRVAPLAALLLFSLLVALLGCQSKENDTPVTSWSSDTISDVTDSSPAETTEQIEYRDGAMYRGGVFEGQGYGKNTSVPIRVQITIDQDEIIDITVLSQSDDSFKFDPAFEKLRSALLGTHTVSEVGDMELVSGATLSSKGIVSAVKDALMKASQ
jgi:uncharacterized protein with FMN-binding domain